MPAVLKVIWRRVDGNPHHMGGRVPLITYMHRVTTCFAPCLTSIHLFHRIRRVPGTLSVPARPM